MRTQFSPFFERVMQATDIENQSQLAKVLGVGRAAISLVKQKNSVPSRWILLLSRAYDLDPVWLAGEDEESEQDMTPADHTEGIATLPWVRPELDPSTGTLRALERPGWPVSAAWLSQWGSPEQTVVLHAPSAALKPDITPGDILAVDQAQTNATDGGIFLLALPTGIILRRLWLQPDGVRLEPGGDQTLQAEEGGDLLGRVLFSVRGHGQSD